MEKFFVSSTKASVQERHTKKRGIVYDIVFRVIDPLTFAEKQKKLSGFATRKAAKQAHTDFLLEYCQLLKPGAKIKRAQQLTVPTLGELYALYLASMQNQLRETTIITKNSVLENFVLNIYEKTPITMFTREELYKWQDKLWATKNPTTGKFYEYGTLKFIRSQFQALLQYGESRYGYQNEFKFVKAPQRRTPAVKMKTWTQQEFDKFLSAVDSPLYRCLFSTLFYTGRRRGEVLALQPADIKFSAPQSFVIFNKAFVNGKIAPTKEGKTATVPICQTLADEMLNYGGNAPYFFGGSKPVSTSTLHERFIFYTKRAGVKPIRIHDLRHSFVSLLIHIGASPTVVAALISDTVSQVTRTYAHLYDARSLNIVNSLHPSP